VVRGRVDPPELREEDEPLSDAPLSQSLIGTWRLVSREDRTASGERRIDPGLGADPIALLVYDRGGNFAAQFMKRDRQASSPGPAAAAGPNNSRAVGGYDAYFGSYTVDDAAGTVTQRLQGALSAENVGLVLTRSMRVTGDELVIQLDTASADGTPVVRTLRWTRAG
jgi:lipocalin-like protein